MASTQQQSWKLLPLPSSSGIPALLVSTAMEPSSYEIRVTDMANIWAETMDRQAICMRGWNENTSIDPSDTPENMTKFLSSLAAALDASQSEHAETGLSLAPGKAADCGDDGLTLRVTCSLRGVAPLKWPIHLRKQPPSSIAIDLVLPLVQAHYARQREIEYLVETIGQKDAAMGKMLDKLDSMGTGLENVFAALSGRKKVTRSAAEERVRGLATFDVRKWKEDVGHDSNGTNQASQLLQDVFGSNGLDQRGSLDVDKSPELDRWWHDFKPATHRRQAETADISVEVASSVQEQDATKDDNDDFQTQSTPPHLRSGDKADVAPADDASTDDEDDSVIPDSHPAAGPPSTSTRPQDAEPNAKPSRLGTIGGKKSAAPRPASSPKIATVAKAQPDDDETASEASEDDVAQGQRHASPVSTHSERMATRAAPKKGGGLGRIGGGTSKPQSAARDGTPETMPDATASKTTPKKLGTIGGKGTSAPSSKAFKQGDDKDRGRGESRKGDDSKKRETSEERADRKREELKRDLEKKAAAGPAKKKRRF